MAGVPVYLFNSSGAYAGRHGVTDGAGEVSFLLPIGESYTFRADVLGSQFFSEAVTVADGGPNAVPLDTGGGLLTLTLQRAPGDYMAGVKAYLFSGSGVYLGLSETTSEQGLVTFEVPSGMYKIRADYLGQQFWTDPVAVASDAATPLTISHAEVDVRVVGENNGSTVPRADVPVCLFTADGAYQGISENTGPAGEAGFLLPPGQYKFRADYLNGQHWSDVIDQQSLAITINEGDANVSVTLLNHALEDVSVYVFDAAGTYLGLTDTTDTSDGAEEGTVVFRLPQGDYNFRADFMGNRYYSGVTTVIADQSNPITVSTGGADFTLTVLERPDDGTEPVPGLPGVTCYLFSADGAYLGRQAATSEQGTAGFDLPDGEYTIRIDYLGYQYWTPVFTIPGDTDVIHLIDHQDITITVQTNNNGTIEALGNVETFLFTADGAYQGISEITDSHGKAYFRLPPGEFQVRVDYLNAQYWTGTFDQIDQVVELQAGTAQVLVQLGTSALEGAAIYVFDANGAYLNINGVTDDQGLVTFQLPADTYKFRADFQSNQYWETGQITAHQITQIPLNTGGGAFELTVQKSPEDPLQNVPVYVFSDAGSYLGMTGSTNDQGVVSFDLADGDYTFRADYMGYQFWTEGMTVPNVLSYALDLPHTEVTVTVNAVFNTTADPVAGVPVYLFTSSGAYQGIRETTESNGQVIFSLPDRTYQVRADYLGQQYWSDLEPLPDVKVSIAHGNARVKVTNSGSNVIGANVYLFNVAGTYLGDYEVTDADGEVVFFIPEGTYKFRVDTNGSQYWSSDAVLRAHEETIVPVPLDPLAHDWIPPDPMNDPLKKMEPIFLASFFNSMGFYDMAKPWDTEYIPGIKLATW